MEMPRNANQNSYPHAGSYLRYSSGLQEDIYSVGTQKRVIEEAYACRG